MPVESEFKTKPRLASAMIKRAIVAPVPFAWVAGDTVYGVGDIENALRRVGKGYGLGVSSTHWFGSWNRERPLGGSAEEIAKVLPSSEWQRPHGWHRYVSLVMLAFAMMAAIRHQENRPKPKKPSNPQQEIPAPHPLINPGNPPDSSAPRAKTHKSRRHHRMVTLAVGSSGRRTKITTVMLALQLQFW